MLLAAVLVLTLSCLLGEGRLLSSEQLLLLLLLQLLLLLLAPQRPLRS